MKILKSILAIMLLLCLLHMPYGYYEVVRISVMVVLGILSYEYFQQGNKSLAIVAMAAVVIFQPFVKFYIGKDIWHILDILLAAFLVITAYLESKKAE